MLWITPYTIGFELLEQIVQSCPKGAEGGGGSFLSKKLGYEGFGVRIHLKFQLAVSKSFWWISISILARSSLQQ